MPTTMNGEGFYVSKGDMATKDTHIKLPSNKFVFMDDFDERSFSIGCWVFGYQNRRFRDPVAIWHSKKAVFSYADGHAKFYKWKDERSYRYAKTTVYNLLATDPDYITNVDASENPVNEDAVFIAAGYTPR
jgi:prepilin-type processing-associated H-X9-DG protein